MWRKSILLVLLLLSVNITLVEAGATDEETILLLYTPRSSMENVKKLDLILHHFSAETKVLDTEMIREDILHEADYIVFYNESEESLPENILEKLHGKKKALIFIGDKVTELWPTMSTEEAVINSVSFTKEGKRFPLEEKVKMHIPNRSPEQEVLLYGFYGEAVMPLLVKNKAGYYLGVTELNDLILQHVAEVLHDIIDNDHPAIHEAYLRLDNIHPFNRS